MKLIKGKNLNKSQRQQVLSAFTYRYLAIGSTLRYATETEWIEDHSFYFTNKGELSSRHNHAEPEFMGE